MGIFAFRKQEEEEGQEKKKTGRASVPEARRGNEIHGI